MSFADASDFIKWFVNANQTVEPFCFFNKVEDSILKMSFLKYVYQIPTQKHLQEIPTLRLVSMIIECETSRRLEKNKLDPSNTYCTFFPSNFK
jgi:hypothetical protein